MKERLRGKEKEKKRTQLALARFEPATFKTKTRPQILDSYETWMKKCLKETSI
jgi:hypothetical protein